MSRRWRPGRAAPRENPGRRLLLWGVVALLVGGLGWLYGERFVTMHRLSHEVAALEAQHQALLREIQSLKDQLARADDPAAVEARAREELGWGYPDELLLVIDRNPGP